METKIVMPKLGESITEGTIIKWHKQPGDSIKKDEVLLEVGTDKVDTEIPCAVAGVVTELLVPENETVDVDTVIAIVSTDGTATVAQASSTEQTTAPIKQAAPPAQTEEVGTSAQTADSQKAEIVINSRPSQLNKSSNRFYSPLVLKMAQQAEIPLTELENIIGTGSQGRVSKKDMQSYIEKKATQHDELAPSTLPLKKVSSIAGIEEWPLEYARKKTAEHMRQSLDTAAHAFLVAECDVSKVLHAIKQHKESFFKQHGVKLSITPFITQAVSLALQEYPLMNSSYQDDHVDHYTNINIGIAAQTEKGLVVPVLKKAETLNFKGIAKESHKLIQSAREYQLGADDYRGSSFTISNFGVYKSLIGLSIINQPNAGILGVGAIKKKPIVLEQPEGDMIAIRSIMHLSLTIDHRLIDGALGAQFLQRIVERIEEMPLNQIL